MTNEFKSQNTQPLTKADIVAAAKTIGCEPAAIQAVSMVESGHSGFITDPNAIYKDCPIILFESHSYHSLTKGKYDNTHPGISTPTWVHNYGASGDHQYNRLLEAMALDRTCALESASWGKYQILASNFFNAGYENPEEFVKGMVESEAAQLDAFVCFIQNEGIDEALKVNDWSRFALKYNGAGQVPYYHDHIEAAYIKAVKDGWNK